MGALKNLIVEAFGVFALVFVGGMAVWSNTLGQGLPQVGLAHGIILGFAIVLGGPISGGQYNPAVTLALALTGDIPIMTGLLYIAAQCGGSFLAAMALFASKPQSIKDLENAKVGAKDFSLGFPQLAPRVGVAQAMIFEFTATFFLVLAVYTGVRTKQNERTIAMYVGGILLCFIQVIGPYTGAALNPCRTLGPAVLTGRIFKNNGWIYYPATLLGGVAAGFFSSLFVHSDESVKTKEHAKGELSEDMTM